MRHEEVQLNYIIFPKKRAISRFLAGETGSRRQKSVVGPAVAAPASARILMVMAPVIGVGRAPQKRQEEDKHHQKHPCRAHIALPVGTSRQSIHFHSAYRPLRRKNPVSFPDTAKIRAIPPDNSQRLHRPDARNLYPNETADIMPRLMGPVTFALLTFGCKVNQYESEALREALLREGYLECSPDDAASLYLINTCTVTETAGREVRRTVRRLSDRHPDSRIVVTGCGVETEGASFPDGTLLIPQDRKPDLPELIRTGGTPPPSPPFPLEGRPVPEIFNLRINRFRSHTRAFLKVEDGCDLRCSYCIVPRVRGTATSRPISETVEEARRLFEAGHREIVLTGVHLGSWGNDLEGRPHLHHLTDSLLEGVPDLPRLRLSSIEANEIDDNLLASMASSGGRLCPHLHIPLQSGDDEILRAMRRRYHSRQFLDACERVASAIPDPAFTTDVIVGFPGETEAQFERTADLCRRSNMSRLHVFPYSPRPGTDAARLKDDVPPGIKKSRVNRLRALSKELAGRRAEGFVGRSVEVLVEKDERGYTERYLRARATGVPPGELVRGRVSRLNKEGELEVSA